MSRVASPFTSSFYVKRALKYPKPTRNLFNAENPMKDQLSNVLLVVIRRFSKSVEFPKRDTYIQI